MFKNDPLYKRRNDFMNKIYEKYNGKIKLVLNTYTNMFQEAEFYCTNCHTRFLSVPKELILLKNPCPKCRSNLISNDSLKLFIFNLKTRFGNNILDNIKIISDFKFTNFPLIFQCTKCGNKFIEIPKNILLKKYFGCNFCKKYDLYFENKI